MLVANEQIFGDNNLFIVTGGDSLLVDHFKDILLKLVEVVNISTHLVQSFQGFSNDSGFQCILL